ncbi:MAG TPA: peptidoglycan-binding domain-containing protein [Candidatus Acidoferrales bacterium]|nr:peptidoglycan-binding domain-containing protein [Candidatus Acidoferrales bacterium]
MQILRQGSEGDDVRRWQTFLIGQGLLVGGMNGVFGPATDKATRAFQKKAKLEVDGAVGPLTLAAAL